MRRRKFLPELFMPAWGGGTAPSPLLTGLTHYWKLDEVTGNRVDSVGAFTMTPSGTVGYEPGKLGNAATFGGSPNHLVSANQLDISPVTGCTVWGWLKVTSASRVTVISSSIANGTDTFGLLQYQANSWRFVVLDSASGASTATDTTATDLDTWYFICGRYNPSTLKAEVRVNGGDWALGSALTNGPKQTTTQSLYINRYFTSYGTGSIDSVGFAARYYTDAEVSLLYNGGAGLEYPF